MSFFVRAPNPEEIAKFKQSLNKWSEQKTGALESQLGDRIELVDSKCCDVYAASIDSLVEERSTEIQTQPSKKDQLNITPLVAHGSFNVWSKASPPSLSHQFQESTVSEEISGTEFYVGCKTCQEKGHTDCLTCQKTGKLVCSQCNGSKKHDCTNCNGYGFFNCNDCNHTGFVDESCPVCDDGKVKCNGCGGSGSHGSMATGKYVDCRQCNGSGKTTCLSCGGRAFETVKCQTCNNGQIPCGTCRTQKIVTCQNCDPQGNVSCAACKGRAILNCSHCATLGGFRSVENLVYKTAIVTNELTISPVDKIRDKIRLSFNDQTQLTQPKIELKEIQSQVPQQELLSPIEKIHAHVSQNRPSTTLLEKFSLKKAMVLDVSFTYENEKGHAYFDSSSGLMLVDTNPLTNKVSNSREQLKASYKESFSKKDIAKARQLIEQAKKLKFQDLADSWKSETDALEKSVHTSEAVHFIKTVKTPALYGLGAATWLVAGFIMPLSFTTLIIFGFLGHAEAKKSDLKLEAGKAKHQKLFKSQLIKLGSIYLAILAVSFFFYYSGSQKGFDKIYQNGAPLIGDAP